MESSKKKKIVSNLNETQQAHTLNRLQSVYNTKVQSLQTKTTRKHLNWHDTAEVEKFVKKYKIPEISAVLAYRYVYGGVQLPSEVATAINVACQQYYDDSGVQYADRLQKANLALATAQDVIIFGDIKPDAVPEFLSKFEEKIAAVVKGDS